jgi:hypothetical protein
MHAEPSVGGNFTFTVAGSFLAAEISSKIG